MTDINDVIYSTALAQWSQLPETDKLRAYTPIDLGDLGKLVNQEMASITGLNIPADNRFAALQCRYQANSIQPVTVRTVQFGLDSNGKMVMLWGDVLIPLNYNKQYKFLQIGDATLITGTEEDTPSGKRPTLSITLYIGESQTPVELSGSVKLQKELYDRENKRDLTVVQVTQYLLKGDTTIIGEIEPGFPTHNLGQGGNRETIASTDLKVGDKFTITNLKQGISQNNKPYAVLEIDWDGTPKSMFSPSEVTTVLAQFIPTISMEVVDIKEVPSKDGKKTYKNPVYVFSFLHEEETFSGIIDSRYVPKPYFAIGEINQPTDFKLLGFTYLTGGMFGPQLVGIVAREGTAAVMKLNHKEILTETAKLLPGAKLTVASCTLSEKDNKNRVSSSIPMEYVEYEAPDYSFVL